MTSTASEQQGDSFAVGSLIGGNYRILAFVGQGGMGYVYKVEHVVLTKILALKILRQEQVSTEVWQRFRNEGMAIARVDHVNIVKIYDMSQTASGLPYYTMDYLEGESLAERLEHDGKLSVREALPIFEQICAGLGYAHDRGIIHRDIKPANIMILSGKDKTPQIKIVDFGIAKLLSYDRNIEQGLTKPGEVFGSPIYMSPEQALGKKVDFRTDMYSLGVTMFQTLTGQAPLLGKNALETIALHQSVVPPAMHEIDQTAYPAQLESIVAQLMSKDPARRYNSLYEVADELKEIESGNGKDKFVPRRQSRLESQDITSKQPNQTRTALLLALVIAVLTGAAYGAYNLFFHSDAKPVVITNKAFDIEYEAPLASVADIHLSEKATINKEIRLKQDEAEAERFIASNKKMYLSKKPGANFVEMSFPTNFSLGIITTHNERLGQDREFDATGLLRIPSDSEITLELSAVVRTHPQLLKFFRPDELCGIAVHQMPEKNEQLGPNITRFTNLTHLDLQESLVDDNDLQWISKISSLRTLNVNSTRITAKALATSKVLPQLVGLSMQHLNDLAPILRVLAHNKELYFINIACCKPSEEEFRLLAKLSKLKMLSLRNIEINDKNMSALATLTGLQELSLDKSNGLTPKSIPIFKRFKKLKTLELPLDLYSKEEIDDLKKALPKANILN